MSTGTILCLIAAVVILGLLIVLFWNPPAEHQDRHYGGEMW